MTGRLTQFMYSVSAPTLTMFDAWESIPELRRVGEISKIGADNSALAPGGLERWSGTSVPNFTIML